MGFSGGFVVGRSASLAADQPGWVRCSGPIAGWVVLTGSLTEGMEPRGWVARVAGPVIAASVLDSDIAWVRGTLGGEPSWEWLVNPEGMAAYGMGQAVDDDDRYEELAAAGRVALAEQIGVWAPAADLPAVDPVALDDVLSRGYVLAEDGLFELLATLGVIDGAVVPIGAPAEPAPIRRVPSAKRVIRPTPPVRIEHEDPASLPLAAGRVFLAAALRHDSERWPAFVRRYELQRWGEPPCVLAASGDSVQPGELLSTPLWDVYVASDPPISIMGMHSHLGDVQKMMGDVLGPWQLVETDPGADLADALAWAQAHVGTTGASPAPNREPMRSEVHSPGGYARGDGRYVRTTGARLGFTLFTYRDLLKRPDALADWFETAHDLLMAPLEQLAGDTLVTDLVNGDGYRRGATSLARGRAWSVKGSLRMYEGTPDGRQRLLTRLRRGELREAGVRFETIGGIELRGMRGSVNIATEPRDQFVEQAGALPDDRPATFTVSVSRELLDGMFSEPVRMFIELMQTTARQFDCVYGYLTADREGQPGAGADQSPYERRWGMPGMRRPRLDRCTAGINWGNLLGPGHLDAVGGAVALQSSTPGARVEPCGTPEAPLWWFQLNDDPYSADRDLADHAAERLESLMPAPRGRPQDERRT
jgi:hypothetical protein